MNIAVFLKKLGSKSPRELADALNWRILRRLDAFYDRRVTGQDLTRTIQSIWRDPENGVGMTNSQASHYLILEKVFSHVTITSGDVFLDVGCGQGRVLAFMIREKYPCRICGIELSEEPGRIAAGWTKKYPNVQVIIGDAFSIDYNPYTILFLSRPFLPETFRTFVEKLEAELKHPVTFIYLFDTESGQLLRGREGWSLQYREMFHRIKGLKTARYRQGYSIWSFDPGTV